MTGKMTIALDAMGGDAGPEMVLPGAQLASIRHPELRFLLFGHSARLAPLLEKYPRLKGRSEVRHCEIAVAMEDKPSQALRRGRGKSSMWLAIESVRTGEAQGVVSAGNTGALMAMARFVLKTIPGIERPAIAAIWPTLRGESVVLDVGATIGADARQLVEFSLMGEAMARSLMGLDRPTVGLLNIGVEEVKGLEEVKEAGRLLRDLGLPLEYKGFIEGDDIGKGTVDVVVTEGFTGNIALKTAEGTAKQLSTYLRLALNRTLLSRLGAFLASGAFATLRERMDPRKHNGGVFLGLNGIVVKSHGGTDALGFATAVDVAIEMIRNGLVAKIAADVAEMNRHMDAFAPQAAVNA
ncbi:phosphate acyltransferase PlsX [Taklimakanibacter lacteus]|uniref:phosphate acyltransferase PlsX n=1 Tax=Taklimakanibacter lacteus TaxID=2268456 RepID=UPI000E671A1A